MVQYLDRRTELATGVRLPPEAYRSPDWLLREQEAVFETNWSLVACVDELAEVGDVVEATIGRCPIFLTRTTEGVRAFHNVCRHRGMAVVCQPGRIDGSVRCPYHGWEYEVVDGGVLRVPQRSAQFADADLGSLGLLPAAVAVWEGLVFAHVNPDAEPFGEYLAEFPAALGSFEPAQLDQVASVDIEGRFNWKLFVENHIDVYHLWYLHETSLSDFDHTKFVHLETERHWSGYEPMRPAAVDQLSERAPLVIDHLDDRDRFGIGAHLLFPNMTMASTAEYFVTYSVVPVSPTRSRVQLRVRAPAGADADALLSSIRSFIDEDIEACERVQMMIASPEFEVGPLAASHEQAIVQFHDALLDLLDVADPGVPVAVRAGARP